MSNINNLVLLENNKLPTMGDVGAGYGKTIGGMVASLPGHIAGYYIGKNMPDNPKKEMNPKKRLHRWGAMLHNRTKVKNIAIAAIGAGLGAALGGGGHHIATRGKGSHTDRAAATGGGAALGALVAHHLFGAGKENRELAKKLKYGPVGQIGASITPAAGIFHPHGQK